MNAYEAVEKRISTRKYKADSMDEETLGRIRSYIENGEVLYKGQSLRLALVENNALAQKNKAGLGCAGGLLKINAPYFIAAIAEEREGYLENAGYVQEGVVLKLTEMGVSTCWLGTYDRHFLAESFGLRDDQRVINVIALGYGYEGRSFMNSIRSMAGSTKRKGVEEFAFYKVFGGNIREFCSSHGSVERICRASSLYPSGNNAQPVYVIFDDNGGILLIKSRDKSINDMKRLDAGIFLSHLHLTSMQEGYNISFIREDFNRTLYKVPEGYEYIISFNADEEWR